VRTAIFREVEDTGRWPTCLVPERSAAEERSAVTGIDQDKGLIACVDDLIQVHTQHGHIDSVQFVLETARSAFE
jgi:hypothetical protein